jgi:hypothetical protein
LDHNFWCAFTRQRPVELTLDWGAKASNRDRHATASQKPGITSELLVIRSQSTVAQMEISVSQADFRGSLIREELTVEGPS